MTTVPMSEGLALSWLPFSFPPAFPFCWKVVVVLDHFSRRMLAIRAFRKEPSSEDIVGLLEATVGSEGTAPKYTVTDKGSQFFSHKSGKPAVAFGRWLEHHHVKPRFGAVGRKGSIAIIERSIKTLKYEGLRGLLVPFGLRQIQAELDAVKDWYNSERPHSALRGATPDEMARGVAPVSERPRFETRPRYPVPSDDLRIGRVRRIDDVKLNMAGFRGRKRLPVVKLDVAA